MKRVCAWCRKELSQGAEEGEADRVITHGICPQCQSNISFQQGVHFQEFIDSLEEPVIMLDPEDRVEAANRKAREKLGKEAAAIKGSKRGTVFECAYARLSEGCGKTEHCSGCAIRRTVARTFESGKSSMRVPATLKCESSKEAGDIRFLISTEKVGGMVLLRIDDIYEKKKPRLGATDGKR